VKTWPDQMCSGTWHNEQIVVWVAQFIRQEPKFFRNLKESE
jgi:hypothetical protein